MKQINYCLTLVCLVTLSACAANQTPVTLQAVGPEHRAESHSGKTGYLMVYSGWAANANIDRHTPYTVTTADGQTTKNVKNSLDMFDGGPTSIALPTGNYQVAALATHTGRVIVPVHIEAGETTSVYLDGYPHLKETADASTPVVKAPNGTIVGWAAQ